MIVYKYIIKFISPTVLIFTFLIVRSHHILIDTDNSLTSLNINQVMQNNGPTNLSTHSKSVKTMPEKMLNQNVAPKASSDGEAKQITNVVYVAPKHARQAKSLFQQKGWLDKRFRMIKVMIAPTEVEKMQDNKNNVDESKKAGVSPRPLVAVPISVPFAEVLSIFNEWILDYGEKELPFSTSQYASKTK